MRPRVQEVRSGETVTLNCSVSGFPVRSVTWTKDSRPVSAGPALRRLVLLNRYALRIQAAQSQDSGLYQCFAGNERDSAQGHAYVRVKCECRITLVKKRFTA